MKTESISFVASHVVSTVHPVFRIIALLLQRERMVDVIVVRSDGMLSAKIGLSNGTGFSEAEWKVNMTTQPR
jgi:hypothetical protein